MLTNFLVASSAGCYDWPVIHQIVIALGWVMNQIYTFFETIGIANLGLCIIVFTLIIKFILLPLTVKQQKFSKMQQMLQPELSAIQKKYKGRRDQYSMQAQQQEMKDLYAKYGTSQTGGCLQTGIQLPILMSLYGVIRFLPDHIPAYSKYFGTIINVIDNSSSDVLAQVSAVSPTLTDAAATVSDRVSVLSILPTKTWNALLDCFSGADLSVVQSNYDTIVALNTFCGIDLSQTPWNQITGAFSGGPAIGLIAILIPLIAGAGQWLSFQLTQNKTQKKLDQSQPRSADPMDQMNNSMKTMGLFMPLISVFFCFTIQSGVGLYWAISSAFQCVLQILINRKYRKMDMEEFKKKNMEKAAAKAKKRAEKGGEKGSTISRAASINTKNLEAEPPRRTSIADRANVNAFEIDKPKENVDPNSLAAKAGLVQQYEAETGDVATTKKKKYKK